MNYELCLQYCAGIVMHYSAAQRNCILHCSVNQNRYLNSNSNNNNNNKQHCRCTVG